MRERVGDWTGQKRERSKQPWRFQALMLWALRLALDAAVCCRPHARCLRHASLSTIKA